MGKPASQTFSGPQHKRHPSGSRCPGVRRVVSTARPPRHQAGFSLVELLVTIAIIVLLISIGAVVATKLVAQARLTEARTMLEALKGVNEEYKALQGQTINVSGTTPINWALVAGSGKMSSVERFVYICKQNATLDTMLMSAIRNENEAVFKDRFQDSDRNSFTDIRDRWFTQIEYRKSNNGKGSGPSTAVANSKLPISRNPFFASAGPDREWGTDDDITTED